MTDMLEVESNQLAPVAFTPGIWYRMLGTMAGLVMATFGLLVLPVAPFIGVPTLAVGIASFIWVRRERAWVGPEGVWINRLPLLRDEFVAWYEIDEVALPIGALRSPWLWLNQRARVRLPMFVGAEEFSDAVSVHAPDVLLRSSEVILHTHDPRGRWIEGVWICDAHRKRWCGACNDKPIDITT